MTKVLITGGSTLVPIDRVRAVSNIFKGRTGTQIARYFASKKNDVTLLTSAALKPLRESKYLKVCYFKTFSDLKNEMKRLITKEKYDLIIHSAAVSDYVVDGIYVKNSAGKLKKIDSSKKISSKHKELYMRLVPTEKLIDKIRRPWNFKKQLVKFKLEVGISDAELIKIAKKSRAASDADLIVANCLEWSGFYAYIIGPDGKPQKVSRKKLPGMLYRRLKI